MGIIRPGDDPLVRWPTSGARRLAVGPEGSDTRAVALTLLAANGVTAATARLPPRTGMDAVQALRWGSVDDASRSPSSCCQPVD